MKEQKGITLIALIITIIVMLILVAVVINFATNDKGIISNARTASEKTKIETDRESLQDYVYGKDVYVAATGDVDLGELENKLRDAGWTVTNRGTELEVKGKQSGETFIITSKGIKIDESIKFYMNGDSSITKGNFSELGMEEYIQITLNDDENATISRASYNSGNTTNPLDDYGDVDVTYTIERIDDASMFDDEALGNAFLNNEISVITFTEGDETATSGNTSGSTTSSSEVYLYTELEGGTKLLFSMDYMLLLATSPITSDGKNLEGTYKSTIVGQDTHGQEEIRTSTITFNDSNNCVFNCYGETISLNYVTKGNFIIMSLENIANLLFVAEYDNGELRSFVDLSDNYGNFTPDTPENT